MLFFNFECINPISARLLIGAFHTKQQRNKIETDKKSMCCIQSSESLVLQYS